MLLLAAQETRDQRQGLGPVQGVGSVILHKVGNSEGYTLQEETKRKNPKSPVSAQGDKLYVLA